MFHSQFAESFYHKLVSHFVHFFSPSVNMIKCFFFIIHSLWWIALIGFWLLKQICTPRINPLFHDSLAFGIISVFNLLMLHCGYTISDAGPLWFFFFFFVMSFQSFLCLLKWDLNCVRSSKGIRRQRLEQCDLKQVYWPTKWTEALSRESSGSPKV